VGGPFPIMGHEGERMLNRKQNRDYEKLGQMVEKGGLGGVHIGEINTLSPKKVWDIIEDDPRGFHTAVRRGTARGGGK
jgi:hypothetical protein